MTHPAAPHEPGERSSCASAAERRARSDLERFFALSRDMVCVVDLEGSITRVNPAFERVLGHRGEDLLGARFASLVHPHDREATVTQLMSSSSRDEAVENRIRCRDGSYRWLQWVSTADRDERLIYAVARDVTDAKRLAEEQAALRRVATLAVKAVAPHELFRAVVEEVGNLFRSDLAGMIHYESDRTVTAAATWAAAGEHPPVQGRWSLEGDRLATAIARTRRPAREDDWGGVAGPIAEFVRTQLGITSSVGCPIVVEDRVWGALFVHSKEEQPLPADTESQLMEFTELVATAMSNAQARGQVRRLLDEQAALRRVATLVARERPQAEVFAAVAEEVGRVLHLEYTRMVRFEDDGTATVVASWGELATALPIGARVSLRGESPSALVFRTGRPVRIGDSGTSAGPRTPGVQSAVGAPIVVDGRLWGAMSTASIKPDPIPADTEARMGQFTELVATAISNLEARSDLAASRARIVAAADEERRRVVRDLHDGAQQRLVHTVITLKLARRALEQGDEVAPHLADALEQAQRATDELRELSHGIMPAVLVRGGLRAAIEALASRAPVPVEIHVSVGRLPAAVEATGYFVVAEALTNVAKHSRAGRAEVTARIEDGALRLRVSDDGVGGARPNGTGLVGLSDRLAALDGHLRVDSAAGAGTVVAADIPLRRRPGDELTWRPVATNAPPLGR
jgi:PAS domain S-box-containing protein